MADKKDIYRNLEYVSKAYFSAEQVFPFWEAAFALIIGQIFIAYFNPQLCNSQKIWLASLGAILSIIWFILVSLDYLNAAHMDRKMQGLCRRYNDILEESSGKDKADSTKGKQDSLFIWPWPNSKDKQKWTLKVILTGHLPDEENQVCIGDLLKSTWFWRKILPLLLCIYWIIWGDILNHVLRFIIGENMDVVRVLNISGITITLIGAGRMYSEAMADHDASITEVGNIIRIINKRARSNARIVIFGAVLQLIAAFLSSYRL
jgi:hypothetical protein